MKNHIALLFLLIGNFCFGQDYLLQAYTTGGQDEIYSQRNMVAGKNGEIYATGLYKNTFYLQGDSVVGGGIYLAKFTNDLSLIYIKKVAGGALAAAGPRIMLDLDNDDNVIIGYSAWSGSNLQYDDSVHTQTNNVELIKLDADGNRLWRTAIAGSNRLGIKGIAVDSENSILVTGKDLNNDAFITKYSANGSEIWYKIAKINGVSNAEKGRIITTDKNNNIYTAGVLSSDYTNDVIFTSDSIYSLDTAYFDSHAIVFPIPNYTVSYLAKYLSDGTLDWVRYVYSSEQTKYNSYGSSTITSLQCFDNGNIAVGGYFTNSLLEFSDGFSAEKKGGADGFRSAFVASFDPDGNRQWVNVLHNTTDGGSDLVDLSIDDNGSVYLLSPYWGTIINELGDTCRVASSSSYNLLLERADANGTIKSVTTLGGLFDNFAYDIVTYGNSVFTYSTIGGNTCFIGTDSISLSNNYGINMLILKLMEDPTLDVLKIATEDELNIYPNPNNGLFNVLMPEEYSELCIYSTLGNLVYQTTIENTNLFNVNIQDYPSGIYFLNVKSKQSNVTKMIKKN